MTILDMLGQSGILTLLGMGVVFSFLIILIIAMTILNKVLHTAGLDKEEKKQSVPVAENEDKTAIVAAIVAAIRQRS